LKYKAQPPRPNSPHYHSQQIERAHIVFVKKRPKGLCGMAMLSTSLSRPPEITPISEKKMAVLGRLFWK